MNWFNFDLNFALSYQFYDKILKHSLSCFLKTIFLKIYFEITNHLEFFRSILHNSTNLITSSEYL